MAEIDSAPSLNAVSRDKKSASVRQADVPTNFNPIWPWQKIYSSTTKKSASVRQPLVSKGPRRNLLGYWDEKIWAGDIWESTDFEIYLRIGTSYRRKKIYSPPPSGFRSVKKDICFFPAPPRLPSQNYRQMNRKLEKITERVLAKLHPSNLMKTIFHLRLVFKSCDKLCKIRFCKKLFAIGFPYKHHDICPLCLAVYY